MKVDTLIHDHDYKHDEYLVGFGEGHRIIGVNVTSEKFRMNEHKLRYRQAIWSNERVKFMFDNFKHDSKHTLVFIESDAKHGPGDTTYAFHTLVMIDDMSLTDYTPEAMLEKLQAEQNKPITSILGDKIKGLTNVLGVSSWIK
jgi:hypothetical protein